MEHCFIVHFILHAQNWYRKSFEVFLKQKFRTKCTFWWGKFAQPRDDIILSLGSILTDGLGNLSWIFFTKNAAKPQAVRIPEKKLFVSSLSFVCN